MKRLIYFKKQFFLLENIFFTQEKENFNHNKRILKVRYFFSFLLHIAYIPALINNNDETTKNVYKTQLVAK